MIFETVVNICVTCLKLTFQQQLVDSTSEEGVAENGGKDADGVVGDREAAHA
jgi:hypothetical protein